MGELLSELRRLFERIRPARRPISTIPAAITFAASLLVPGSASGWEIDVHYGLTRWLALQAGFGEHEADLIAEGDEGVDDSWMTGPIVNTIAGACLRIYPNGAVIVHDFHFASRVDPPASPDKRNVVAREVWRKQQSVPPPKLTQNPDDYRKLGAYLHVLQDSWSHQGTPDVPYFCASTLGWGHAFDRGGWSCHLADLTYRWAVQDVPGMAQA